MINFEEYPFEKLASLLDGITPNPKYEPRTLTIGEPQFQTPSFIQDALCQNSAFLNKYPKTAGEDDLNSAMRGFVKRRFGVELLESELVSTFGTREVLFNFPQFYLFENSSPVMAFTNPFYQIYEGAAICSNATVHHLDLTSKNNFIPDTNSAFLKECDLVILNFPNNPTTSMLTLSQLEEWVELALKHDFLLINDECYSEIYTDDAPSSLLEASKNVGNCDYKNILVLNSISKRSSAPGLRSGFIAGDKKVLDGYRRYRTYVGCASPIPLQKAAELAWSDDEHVEESRKIYRENFALAKDILRIDPPKSTFYIWLKVKDAIATTLLLYKEYNLKVLPGCYLSRESADVESIAKEYIRIALVESPARTKESLERIKEAICKH